MTDEETSSGSERMRVLEMIESGRISAEQGVLLLRAISETNETATTSDEPEDGSQLEGMGPPAPEMPEPALETDAPGMLALADETPAIPASESQYQRAEQLPPQEQGVPEVITVNRVGGPDGQDLPFEAARWRRFWMIPLWVGVGITVVSGTLMFLAMQADQRVAFWFVCASFPFALGVIVMALAFHSRTWPWLHLRVQQRPGESPQRIAISFPLPVRQAAWFLRTFGHAIPAVREHSVDEVILAVGENTSPDNPIYIQVDEEDGEHVEIYIG